MALDQTPTPSPLPATVKEGALFGIVTVVWPTTWSAPPAPCAPVLPSSKVHSTWMEDGGEADVFE